MKYIKLFEEDKDAIYNRTTDTLYSAPGVSYIIDVDKVVYAPFTVNEKYYINEQLNAVLYRDAYIDITSSSENVILTDLYKEKSYIIKFEYKKILPETISIVIQQTGNMTYSYSDITIDEETCTGEFTLTVSSEEYDVDTLYINLIGIGENELEFTSNIVRYTISYEDNNKPLTLSILEDGQVRFGNLNLGLSNIYYKLNDGQWSKYIETLPINVHKGDKLQFKGNNTSLSQPYSYKQFSSTCKFNVSGYLVSLLSEDYETLDLSNVNQTGSYSGCFSHMFANSKVVDASQLIMPKLITECCYSGMMAGCFDLEYAPELQEFTTLYKNSYADMFKDCQNLKYAPTKIIAETIGDYACSEMFRNCTTIQTTPKIQIENLGSGGLAGTFENCVSLINTDDIELTTVADYGCYNMFKNCVGLRDISKFNLNSLIDGNNKSFMSTFKNCVSLYKIMESIELETVCSGCFCGTFAGCFTIEETPIMKYNSVACGACCGMFEDCTNLKSVPLLDVVELNGEDCFDLMFKNCENLNYIKTTLPDWGGDNFGNQKYTYDWVNNVAEEGTFVKPEFLPIVKGVNNIPTNWLVENMEDPNLDKYLAFTILEDGDITITNKTNGEGIRLDLQYKLNDNDWENIQLETKTESSYPYKSYYIQTLNLNQGDIIKFRGDNILTDGDYYDYDNNAQYLNRNNIYFSGSAKFNVSGQISSLLSKRCNSNNVKRRSFEYLFEDCHVVDASELILTSEVREDTYSGMMAGCFDLIYGPKTLPAKYLYTECYRAMFSGCTSLVKAPEIKAEYLANSCCYEMFSGCTSLTEAPLSLPAESLSSYCYYYMFYGCTSLETPPELPATSLSNSCYNSMFYGCTSLKTAPELPAQSLSEYCYSSMFSGCTSLTQAPLLPAETLASRCYNYMFRDCTSLTEAPSLLPATSLSSNCYESMFQGCTSLTEAPELPATSLSSNCYNSMFYGCTSLTQSPELPATSLSESCYEYMFYGCTSLETAPSLPATTLAYACYRYMFQSCTNLTQAPSLPAISLSSDCYSNMFYNCSSLITAPDLPATTLADSCYEQMFRGCTSLTQAPSLPARTLTSYCYYYMFSGCTSLVEAPELSGTSLDSYCYYSMFSGCTSLTQAPELPATTLKNYCYKSMFSGCTSLTQSPSSLPAKTLTSECYSHMFENCTNLETAPEIKAQSLSSYCCYYMFSGCTSLTQAPELPATTLANSCYSCMFYGCTNLTQAPELSATTLVDRCYNNMFDGCTKLNYIKVGFSDWKTNLSYYYEPTYKWTQNVSESGIFECPENLPITRGVSYIPEGWSIKGRSSVSITNKSDFENVITTNINENVSFTLNVSTVETSLNNCNIISSNSNFVIGDVTTDTIIISFISETPGVFETTITIEDKLDSTISDSVVLTVNVSEPEKSYYLRYSNNDNYNTWTNEVAGTELDNGDIVFEPLNFTINNNFIALITQANDASLSTNVKISDFTGSHDGSIQDIVYQEWGGKDEYRISAVSDGEYSVIINLTNKTIYAKVYSSDEPVDPDEPIEPTEDTSVKTATYNIRYYNGEGDTDNEGGKSWLTRRSSVFDMIEKHNPDVCGLQEVTPQMTQDIIDNLPDYTYIGYGRVSGDLNPILPISTLVSSGNDEQTSLIYKTSKYTELEKGRFFVSDTPSVPSKYSESSFNRLAAYVKLKDNETGKEFYFLSTHLDHPNDNSTQDELCREKQATALIKNAKLLVGNLPYYIVGDFNSIETEEAYPIIAAELNDAYYTVGPENAQGGYNGTNNTYTGLYSSTDTIPKRIDFIFTTDNISVSSYIADNDNMGLTMYPSDHLPVVCNTVIQ